MNNQKTVSNARKSTSTSMLARKSSPSVSRSSPKMAISPKVSFRQRYAAAMVTLSQTNKEEIEAVQAVTRRILRVNKAN